METTQETTHVFTAKDAPDCAVDGLRGVYVGLVAQEMAKAYGWKAEVFNPFTGEHTNNIMDTWLLTDALQIYHEATDEATEYLNSLCSDDVLFVWSDNNLLLINRSDDYEDLDF